MTPARGPLHPFVAARTARWTRVGLACLGALLVIAAAPVIRRPRDPAEIRRVMADGPHTSDCDACHTSHGADRPTVEAKLLLWPNDNEACAQCHTTAWQGGSFGGGELYAGSPHAGGAATVWPGPDPPSRIEPDAPGKCLNCHDAHGRTDPAGRIPALLVQREERTCLACHDGSPAASDVRADFQKPFRHPVTDFTGRHTGGAESLPEDFGVTPLNRRHAECQDCHNPHVSRPDPLPPSGTAASLTTLGVSRLRVVNGAAGTVPGYLVTAGSDTLSGPPAEYQLCFKCHSSWTTQPSGQTDLARVLNPANPSYHPVEAPGRNPGISPLAFVPGWNATSTTRCGDCHGSDFGAVAGPHGSAHRYILKQPYAASSMPRAMGPDEACFACHSYDVYANPASAEMTAAASRFNAPLAVTGHAGHVGTHQVPCYACHVTHGSATQPFLIATGRAPGILSYTATPTGGTCAATCHGSQTYTVNYAR